MNLLEELSLVAQKFEEEKIEYALCGGLAMAIYAFPRATLDIDFLIEPDALERAKSVAANLGFVMSAGIMEFCGGSVKICRMTKPVTEPGYPISLDLLLVTPEMREAWNDRRGIEWENGVLTVVSPKGLIALKNMRQSGQDRDDIERLKGIIDED